MTAFITEYPQFFTASIKGWFKLLEPDKYKDIIMSSLQFLVEDKRIKLYAFVIMSDHIHLIWQMQPLIHPQHVQRDFLKYTAQLIKHDLQKNQHGLLLHFEADANDRSYHFPTLLPKLIPQNQIQSPVISLDVLLAPLL